jgi:hypothetical protein
MKTAIWPFSARKLGRILVFSLFAAAAWPQAGFGSNFYQGVATNTLPWPGGIVPYKFDTNVSPTEQSIYLAGMKEWELAANIHFVPYTNQANFVLLRFDYTQGTDTYVASFPQAVMTVDTLSRAQVGHETGHLLGFQHEHVRTDRNTYITVNFTNLIGSGGGGTNGSGEGSSVSNLYIIDPTSTPFGAYDFESVMHYSRTLFSTNPDVADTIDPNASYYAKYYYRIGNYALSPGDRAGAAFLYGPPTTALTNVVTNTADSGLGSLRAALYYANDHPGTTIRFNISTNDSSYSNGVYTIFLSGELPPLVANGTVIDATTQPGYTNQPVVALSGAKLNSELAYPNILFNCGLRLYAANCVVDGLSIHDFPFLGIAVEYAFAVSNRIEGCYIGLAPNSTDAAGNFFQGISIDTGASFNFVGGTSANQRNVLSGNDQYGVWLSGTNGLFGATKIGTNTVGNVILGNYIGTDGTGTHTAGNLLGGVIVSQGATAVTVGGTNAGAGNVLSGNGGAGVWIVGVSNNVVQGNYIGLNAAGTAPVPNSVAGIKVEGGANSNLIGGTVTGARNVISGNASFGIHVLDAGTANLAVQGNYIGMAANGVTAFSNNSVGIYLENGPQNITIGGALPGQGNVISGNGADGVEFYGAGTSYNSVLGNYIGTASNGVTALPNMIRGVYLQAGAQSNFIGGLLPGQGNVISGNANDGIQIYGSGTSFNTIQGNYIGTTKTGLSPVGNGGCAVSFIGAENNVLGGTSAAARNLLCASTNQGIFIYFTGNEVVQGNYIGVGADGATPMGNGLVATDTQAGIYVLVGTSNLIGGAVTGAGNVISANGNDGVQFFGTGADFNVVQGNYIGTTATGLNAIGNGASGVSFLYGPQSNTLGGATAAAGNVIAGNSGVGVFLAGSSNTIVQGNDIGVGADGTTALGNQQQGVLLQSGATSNTIGLALNGTGAGNVIANNAFEGIIVYDAITIGNTFLGNSIYNNGALGINLSGDPGNHVGGAVPGPEDFQNYPVITGASVALGTTTVKGTLNSTANHGFLIGVYRNASPDPSGYGEGQTYVGSANLTTDPGGNGSFTLTAGGGFAGQYFTVTATDATTGDTSEFGLDVVATNGPAPLSFLGPYSWNRSNGFSFSMALQTNQNYTVQATTNLAANPIVWTNLTNFTATNTTTQFLDRSATNHALPARFYRIVSP